VASPYIPKRNTDSSVGKAADYVKDDRGSNPGRAKIFTSSETSKSVLSSNQPPIRRIPGSVSLEVRRPGRETDHSLPSSVEMRNG
jgi:hypothetical protein